MVAFNESDHTYTRDNHVWRVGHVEDDYKTIDPPRPNIVVEYRMYDK